MSHKPYSVRGILKAVKDDIPGNNIPAKRITFVGMVDIAKCSPETIATAQKKLRNFYNCAKVEIMTHSGNVRLER